MQVIGLKYLKLADLNFEDEVLERVSHPRIKQLATSISSEIGLLQQPMVRQSDMTVIFGRDRVAAHLFLDKREILVKLVECSDLEWSMAKHAENADRRHSIEERDEERASLISLVLEDVEKKIVEDPDQFRVSKHGNAPKARNVAHKRVANALGLKPDTVRRAEDRAQQRAEEKAKLATLPPIETFGIELDLASLEPIVEIQKLVDAAAAQVRSATGQLGRIQTLGLPFHEAKLNRVYQLAQELGEIIRGCRPESVCPFCKGNNLLQPSCAACMSHGYTTADQAQGVPKELRRKDELMVADNGKIRPLSDFIETPDWMG